MNRSRDTATNRKPVRLISRGGFSVWLKRMFNAWRDGDNAASRDPSWFSARRLKGRRGEEGEKVDSGCATGGPARYGGVARNGGEGGRGKIGNAAKTRKKLN